MKSRARAKENHNNHGDGGRRPPPPSLLSLYWLRPWISFWTLRSTPLYICYWLFSFWQFWGSSKELFVFMCFSFIFLSNQEPRDPGFPRNPIKSPGILAPLGIQMRTQGSWLPWESNWEYRHPISGCFMVFWADSTRSL